MAFSSPSFASPSIPKLNRRTISSPLSSSASKISGVAPKLKTSRMRFFRPSLKKTNVTAEAITQKSSIENTLAETNTILVEIQKQLSLDFAMRIAEEKEKNKVLTEDKSKRRLALKEGAVESTRKIGNIVKSATGKILAPVKGVFDKIIEFLSIIGTGIAANAVFEWLKDDENRKKIDKWFGWIKDHWKWVLAGLGAIALLPVISTISGLLGPLGAIVGLLGKAVPLLISFLMNPLTLKAMLAIGAGVLIYKGGEILFKEVRKIFTGSQGFSDAHDKLDQKLRDAGLDQKGRTPVKRSGKNRGQRKELTEDQIKVRDSVMKKREQLKELSKNMDEEIKSERSKIMGNQMGRSRSRKNSSALRESKLKITQKYEAKIPSIVGDEIEARKMGGPVMAEKPYLVGEEGPELIVPKISGTVINNTKTEKIYKMISSKNAGKVNFVTMDLPPQVMKTEKSIPSPPAPEVPNISSTNAADLWRNKTPDIYGIYV